MTDSNKRRLLSKTKTKYRKFPAVGCKFIMKKNAVCNKSLRKDYFLYII